VGYNGRQVGESGKAIKTCMFIGEYKHTLDEKKRISIPSKFKAKLGKKVVVTRGLDNCLFIYPVKEWAKIAEKLARLGMGKREQRGFNRFMLGGATEISIDGVGRILIPETLKNFAKIKSKVVFAGVFNRIEVWNDKAWETYTAQVEKDADAMAEKLGEIGAI
jgi:MraZ protein